MFAWSLLAAVVLLGALAGPFFAGRVYTRDDLGAFHLPTRAFYAEQLARGEPFDWMPHLYCGFYLTGEGQAGTYHPWHWMLYRYLPLPAATGCEWLAAYPAMLAGTWFFLVRLLRRRDAAMLGSLLFTFSGFNLLHFLHPNAIAVVAHVPWLLWAIDVALVDSRRRNRSRARAAVALLTGSQLLLGYPQYVWFSLLAECAYVVFVLVDRRHAAGNDCGESVGRTERPWTGLIVAKGCGLLLGGVQLLPTVDALAHSSRQSVDATFAQSGSLHPWNLVQLVAPYTLASRVVGQNTHELGLYAGAVPLMLAVWLLVDRRRLGRLKHLTWATGGFAVGALLLAFGKYGWPYRLQQYVPLVNRFRFPCRYVVLFHLAMAVLAAVGFALLAREHQRSRLRLGNLPPQHATPRPTIPWRRFGPLWAVVGLSVVVALMGLLLQGRWWMASVPAVLAGPVLLGTAAVLVALAARGGRPALVGLVLFAAADLGVYGLSYSVYPHAARLQQFIATVSTPPGVAEGRVMASLPRTSGRQALRVGNQITLAGWHRADGYAGLQPQQQLDYRRLPALRVASVRWVRRGPTAAQIRGLQPYDDRWLQVPQPLPRVRLVSRTKASNDPARDLPRIDVDSTALTEVPLELPAAEPGTATLLSARPGRLQIRCQCTTPQLLVVSESFHSGWQAIVDHQPQKVLRVNGDFIGCLVGPGRHQVVLQFRPRSLSRGRIASCVGLGLIAVCFVGCGLRRRPRPLEDRVS